MSARDRREVDCLAGDCGGVMTVRMCRMLVVLGVAGSVLVTSCGSQEPAHSTALSAITSTSSSTTVEPSALATAFSSPETSSAPSSTETPTPTPVPVPVEASALPMPASGGTDPTVPAANAQEQADRDAIEAVWRQTLALTTLFSMCPRDERPGFIYAVATDPIAADILAVATRAEADGASFFGRTVPHPYWYRAVDGQNYAEMGDCQDASAVGAKNRAGQVLSRGVVNNSAAGRFVKDPQTGSWRVFQIHYLTDVPCTAQVG